MMEEHRKELGDLGDDDRFTFRGVFVRTGSKGGKSRLTVLLKDVRKKGSSKVITDHIWFNYTDGFRKLDLYPGDEVEFDARVKEYKKGYWGDNERKARRRPEASISYKLSHPTKVKKTGNKKEIDMIESNWEKKKKKRR